MNEKILEEILENTKTVKSVIVEKDEIEKKAKSEKDEKIEKLLELKIEEFLKETWERFFSEYPMLWITVADFYLPDKRLVIYADWNYWHDYPHWTNRDHYIRKELRNENYKVISFWESEINNEFDSVKDKIKEML